MITHVVLLVVHLVVLFVVHLQLISFAIAPFVLLVVLLIKNDVGGAIANESTVEFIHIMSSVTAVLVGVVQYRPLQHHYSSQVPHQGLLYSVQW